jgi:GT2 family glycosyltransferase
MESTERVAAVVVTFNRKNLLCECLDGLLTQTTPLASVLIIDNASNDGTAELLGERGYLGRAGVEYIRLPLNTGGAGGFHEGVKRAFEEGFDWAWLMDDDVEPLQDALETMLSYGHMSRCIQASKVFKDGQPEGWEKWTSICNSGRRCGSKGPYHKDYVLAETGCFEGMLIHRQTISRIGFPDRRFFVGGDDVAYGYLASKHTQVIYVRRTCFIKKIRKYRDVDLLERVLDRFRDRRSRRYYFLSVRNELLVYGYTRDSVRTTRFCFRIAGLLLKYSLVTLICERSFLNCLALWKGTFQGYGLLISPRSEFDVGTLETAK